MNVLMLLSNAFTHDPRVYAEARSLRKAGYRVTVLARDRGREHPIQSVLDGISIERVRPPSPLRRGNRLVRPFTLVWNGFILLFSQWQMCSRALRLHRREGFSVIHCHDLDTLLAGVALKRKTGLPLIYDAHEIYGYMLARQLPLWIASRFLWLEKRLMRWVDRIINVCEPQREYFATITDKPVTIVMNCKPLQGLEYQPPDNEDFTLLYIGVLHQGRAVPMLVRAVGELAGVRGLIGGLGQPAYVQALIEECSRTPGVTFLGMVPPDEVIPMTGKADCVFLMVSPEDLNNRIGLANKQFEAMVCGRPIICTRGTYSGDVTEQEGVGLTAEYNEASLKRAITRLRDDPELGERLGRNALQAALTKYNWENEERKLLDVYKSISAL